MDVKPSESSREGAVNGTGRGRTLQFALVLAGLVGAIALASMWNGPQSPTTSGQEGRAEGDANTPPSAAAIATSRPGGVAARRYDEPSRPAEAPRRNPAIQLPDLPTRPAPPPPKPRPSKFENLQEEIAWYEDALTHAEAVATDRRIRVEALQRRVSNLANNPNAGTQLAEMQAKVPNEQAKYDDAVAEVARITEKLAQLRGR